MRRAAAIVVVLLAAAGCGPLTPEQETAAMLREWADCLEDNMADLVADQLATQLLEDADLAATDAADNPCDLPGPDEVSPEVLDLMTATMPDLNRAVAQGTARAILTGEGFGAVADRIREAADRLEATADE